MRKIIIVFIALLYFQNGFAQDLNARVEILSPQVQNTNKRPLEVLKAAIQNFLNNRKWSNDELKPQEKIDCNFVITIKEWDGSSNYVAEAQIISSRPVFNSTYNSPLLSITDKNFDFNYSEGQPLEFSDQNYISNLSSMLAFYAEIIVGLDYDSFSHLGGSAYFNKAQIILNNAQNAGFVGWKAFENLRNRYWLIENLTSKSYLPLRELMYTYHREGLDQMAEDRNKAQKVIFNTLPKLEEIDRQKQGAIFNQAFFSAKSEEIINIFSQSPPTEKMKVYNLLSSVDPANTGKYEILKKRP